MFLSPFHRASLLPGFCVGSLLRCPYCLGDCTGQASSHSLPCWEGMSVSPQRCGPWGGGVRACEALGTGLGEPYLPRVLSSPNLILGLFSPGGSFSTQSPVLPADHTRHPGQCRALRVAALRAQGRALTCSHTGKQPQAGLGRGPKARGGKGAAAGRTRDRSQLE